MGETMRQRLPSSFKTLGLSMDFPEISSLVKSRKFPGALADAEGLLSSIQIENKTAILAMRRSTVSLKRIYCLLKRYVINPASSTPAGRRQKRQARPFVSPLLSVSE